MWREVDSPSMRRPRHLASLELLPLGRALLMWWGSQPGLLRQVHQAPCDGAGALGRLLPAPGFLRAAGVGSWLGQFGLLSLLPRCLPTPLQGAGDVVAEGHSRRVWAGSGRAGPALVGSPFCPLCPGGGCWAGPHVFRVAGWLRPQRNLLGCVRGLQAGAAWRSLFQISRSWWWA